MNLIYMGQLIPQQAAHVPRSEMFPVWAFSGDLQVRARLWQPPHRGSFQLSVPAKVQRNNGTESSTQTTKKSTGNRGSSSKREHLKNDLASERPVLGVTTQGRLFSESPPVPQLIFSLIGLPSVDRRGAHGLVHPHTKQAKWGERA